MPVSSRYLPPLILYKYSFAVSINITILILVRYIKLFSMKIMFLIRTKNK